MKRILAFDYGRKHIGVAFSESLLAQPLEELKNDEGVIENIKERIGMYQPELLVVGHPDGPLEEEVKAFADSLRVFRLPVTLHPETLSTQEAINKLRQARVKKAKLKSEHSYAACIILEDYLEKITVLKM